MSYELIVTLTVMLLTIIAFGMKKIKYGVIVMTAVTALCFLGVIDVKTALSGLSSTTTVLVATMFVMAGALGKTSVVGALKARMEKLGSEHEALMLLAMTGACFVITIFVGQTACMCIMFLFVSTLPDKGKLAPTRMVFYACAVNAAWFGRIPFGINLSLSATLNGFYSGIIEGHPEWALGTFDLFIGTTIPAIILTIYSFFCIKFLPIHEIDDSVIPKGTASVESKMSRRDELVVFALFIAMSLGFFFSKQIGDYQYIIPVACVLGLFYFKIMSLQDIVRGLTVDMVWLMAGMTVISSALASSGAADAIGNVVLNIVGDHPDPFFLIFVLGLATMIPANFTSHMGTFAIMSPIAASIAIAGGMNPVPLVLTVFICGSSGIAFPSGNTGAMIAFGAGNYTPAEGLKFTLPYLALTLAATVATVPLLYPIY